MALGKYVFELSARSDLIFSSVNACTNDLIIYKESDHYHDTHDIYYYLDSQYFECATNIDSAYVIALEILDLLNGYVQIDSTHHITKPVKIIGAYQDTHRVSWHCAEYVPNYTWQKVNQIMPVTYSYRYKLRDSLLHALIHLAKIDMAVYCLLKFASQTVSWVSLYKSFETLKNSVEANESLGCTKNWTTTQSSKKLTKAANKYDIVGLDSRHGYNGIDIDINTSQEAAHAALLEARDWLMPLIKEHLIWKAYNYINRIS